MLTTVYQKVIEKIENRTRTSCGQWAVLAMCAKGLHLFAKKIYCGKEWCRVCGQNRSAAHNRRISRIIPKALKFANMGYYVIEFPIIYRHLGKTGINPEGDGAQYWCYSKKDLRATTNQVIEVFAGKRTAARRRHGGYYERGLLRWHWFGDKKAGHYNPHINILVDGARLEKIKLAEIKNKLREKLNCPDLIINYSYARTAAAKFHKVAYITRSTFHDFKWDEYMANEIYNFRNMRWWGKWDGPDSWTVDRQTDELITEMLMVEKIHENKCPCCNDGDGFRGLYKNLQGRIIYWTRPVDSTWLKIWRSRELAGSGVYVVDQGGVNGPEKVLTAETVDNMIYYDQAGPLIEGENDRQKYRENLS